MSVKVEIKSDNKFRELFTGIELKQWGTDGDFLDDSKYFKYRGEWYNLDDFMLIGKPTNPDSENWFSGWDGILPETAFSAVVIKLKYDGFDDCVVVGYAISS